MPAAAATITFDTLPGGTVLPNTGTTISNQYAALGATFLGTNTATGVTGALNAWGLIAASGPGGSGNYLGNFGVIPAGGPSNYLLAPRYNVSSVFFANAASNVSFGLYTGGGQNSVTVNAYNAVGTLLQSLANVQANNGQFDIQTLSANDIARLDIVGGFYTGGTTVKLYGIDNLTFTAAVAAVPEPMTWGMMLAGFGMTGAAMRRRKTSAALSFG